MGTTETKKQQGGIMLMMLGLAFVFISCAVLALDTGRLYLERQRLQAQADMMALEVTSRLQMQKGSSGGDLEEALADILADQAFISRNGFDGLVPPDAALVMAKWTPQGWNFAASSGVPAIQVELTRHVPDSLVANLASLWPGSGFDGELTLKASSVALRPTSVSFSVGTSLLAVDSADSPLLKAVLEEMLGTGVDLNLAGSSGLIDTYIALKDLMLAAGTESTDELLGLSLSAVELAQLSVDALSSEGNLASTELAALNNLIANASVALTDNLIRIGDILSVDPSGPSALDAELSLGQLLSAAIYGANQGVIQVDDLSLDAGLVTADIDLNIISPPVIAIGPVGCQNSDSSLCDTWRTTARQAQVELGLTVRTELLGLVDLTLGMDLGAVQAEAGIASVESEQNGQYRLRVEGRSQPLSVDTSVLLDLLPAVDGLLNLEVSNASGSDSLSGAAGYDRVVWPPAVATRIVPQGEVTGVITAVDAALSDVSVNLTSKSLLISVLLQTLNPLLDVTVGSLLELTGLLTDELAGLTETLLEDTLGLSLLLEGLGTSSNDVDVEVLDVSYGSVNLVN